MNITDETTASLQWLDYLVVGIVLLISALIGIYYRFTGGRQKTTEEYFSANRSMSVPLLSIALMVACVSAITILGASGESYIYGSIYAVNTIGYIFAAPITAYLYLPVFFKLRTMSVYEYLNERFGPTARLAASLAMYAQCSLGTGIVLYAPALAVEATTGLSSTTSILLIGLICAFYSSIGGIKAVLATDVFQGFLIFASVFCVIGIGCNDIEGGISKVWESAQKSGRLDVFHFDMDPTVRHTWWSLIFGSMGIYLGDFAVNQIYVQRLLSAGSLKSAQLALFLKTPLIVLIVWITSFAGLVLYVWFEGCDPVTSGRIASFDQVMPYFAKIRLSKIPGLSGFFIAGIFSAALSTASAALNSLAAIAIADYIIPVYRKLDRELSDTMMVLLGKILVVVNGLLCVGIAFLASKIGHVLQTNLAIYGTIGGPLLGLFSLGIFIEVANEKGAVTGALLSLILSAWISFGHPKPPIPQLPVSIDECTNSSYLATAAYNDVLASSNADDTNYFYPYRISYMWYTPLGWTTTMLFGYIASIVVRCFSKDSIAEPDADLFTPILAARIKKRRRNIAKTRTSQVFVLNTNECDSCE